mgnify:CR=1 FL=1
MPTLTVEAPAKLDLTLEKDLEMRPLTLRNSDYNEYFTPGSLLVEIGAAGNSLDEALKAVRVFGEGFAEVVTGK